MLFALIFVIWVMIQARDPRSWNWLWMITGEPIPQSGAAAGDSRDEDNRHSAEQREPLALDEFRSPRRSDRGSTTGAVESTIGFFPGVDVEYLRMVEDNKVFRKTGESAWLNLIEVLHDNDQRTLEAASTGLVTYAQLAQQPQQYRGQLVDLEGFALRCLSNKTIENDLGIETLYGIILRAAGGPDKVISVYVLELPEGFPTGEKLREPIGLTGFFFKNRAVSDGADLFLCPTLLSKTIRWSPKSSAVVASDGQASRLSTRWAIILVASLVALACGMAYLVYLKSNALSRARRGAEPGSITIPDSLEPPVPTVDEAD